MSDFRRLEGFDKFLICRVVFVFGPGGDDVDIGAGIVFGGDTVADAQAGGDGVSGVDDGAVGIIDGTGQLAGFQFYDVDVPGIGGDVLGRQFGLIGTIPEGDPAQFAQEQQSPAAIIGVVGDGDAGAVRYVFDIRIAVG